MKWFIMFFVLALVGCSFGSGSEGLHRGHITDVSISGWFCSTYEGQIQTGTGQSSIKYEFTVTSPEVFNQLRAAQESGQEVNVHYISPRFYWLCNTAHDNLVDGIVNPGLIVTPSAGLSGGGSHVLDTH